MTQATDPVLRVAISTPPRHLLEPLAHFTECHTDRGRRRQSIDTPCLVLILDCLDGFLILVVQVDSCPLFHHASSLGIIYRHTIHLSLGAVKRSSTYIWLWYGVTIYNNRVRK